MSLASSVIAARRASNRDPAAERMNAQDFLTRRAGSREDARPSAPHDGRTAVPTTEWLEAGSAIDFRDFVARGPRSALRERVVKAHPLFRKDVE
jgi:hypothetical protein